MVGKFIENLINKQFEMIKVDFRYTDIPEDGIITVNKKKKYWYEEYMFESQDQYNEWRKYITEQLKNNMKEVNKLDFSYGLVYKYKKEGV